MELTHKDYKRINNLHNDGLPGYDGLPGFKLGKQPDIASMSSTDYQQDLGDWTNALNNANYNSNPAYSSKPLAVDTSVLPKSGTYDFAGRTSATTVPNNLNVLPGGKPLQTPPSGLSNAASGGSNALAIQGGLSAVPEFGQHMYDSWTNYDSQEDLRARYKDTGAYAGGIGYNVLTHTGEEREDNTFGNILGSTASGASVGSMFGPWGAVIGGAVGLIGSGLGSIFSSGKLKLAERLMAYKINNINNDRTGNALTLSMRLNYGKEHGDSSQQYLYGAKNGKLPGFELGKQPAVDPNTGFTKRSYLTDTAYGTMFMKANGLGKPGEVISDMKTGATSEIAPNLPGSIGDKIPIYADRNTAILTDDWVDPVTKKTYAQAAKDGDDTIQNLVDRMAQYVNPSKQTKYAKNGKLPKFKEGGWANAITSGLGGLAALGLYITASKNKPYRPNTYVENPYEIDALSTLAGLRVNPYPIMQELRNAESRTNRIIDRSGGLSTAQRGLSRLSALYGTLSNIANTLSSIQNLNNQYKASYANTAPDVGANNAQRRMAANLWDLDYFSKAHAARLGGMQTGIQNMLAQTQNWYRNDFKRRQFNDTMALYKNQLNIDLQGLQLQANQFTQQMALANRQLNLQNQLDSYLDILNDRDRFMKWAKNKGWKI